MMMGRYEIEATIGRGAMGHVYRAYDRERGMHVALKRMRGELSDWDGAHAHLRTEADLASRVEGPHAVRVLDVSTEPGAAYVAYELLEGESLRARIARDGALPIELAREVVSQLARALADVHAAGVAHRDVKPENVFIVPSADGSVRVKLLDFGLADDGESDDIGGGTADYLPPEVLLGERRATMADDLYALGVVAYECLTGARPHDGAVFDDLAARLSAETPSVPGVPAALDVVVRCATSPSPALRFATAAELAAALEAATLAS